MSWTKDTLENLKTEADIVRVISRYMLLKKSGKNYKGLCPFHNEKTPSFMVNSGRGIYHCFGCGESGDVFSFVMKMDNLDFPEAVRRVAEMVGFTLPEEVIPADERAFRAEKKDERIFRVNELALIHFEKALAHEIYGKPGREYLRRRGISEEVARKFRLGYSLTTGDALHRSLLRSGVREEEQILAGLVLRSERGHGFYDRFRGRLIFPIFDRMNRVVGFGGRALDETMPKYLNSPETPVFVKSRILYGYNLTRKEIVEKKQAILVEGYLDLLSLYQAGIKNVLAPLGTGFSDEHVKQIEKVAESVILLFDSDRAGEDATRRAAIEMAGSSLDILTVRLEGAKDPDEFLRSKGPAALFEVLRNARNVMEFLVELAKKEYGGELPNQKLRCVAMVAPFIKRAASPLKAGEYMKIVAEKLDIEYEVLQKEIARFREKKSITVQEETREGPERPGEHRTAQKNASPVTEDGSSPGEKTQLSPDEAGLLRALLELPVLAYAAFVELSGEDFSPVARVMLERLISLRDGQNVLDVFQDEPYRSVVFELLMKPVRDAERQIADSMKKIKVRKIDNLLKKLKREIKEAEKLGNEKRVRELQNDYMRLFRMKTV